MLAGAARVKALRHYHELGLLEPADIDPATGYRRYRTTQVPTAQVIRRLRELDMPLEEVKAVLRAPDVASRNEAIVAHLQRMERHLEQTQAAVAALRGLLDPSDTPISVEYRSVPATPAIAIHARVAMSELLPGAELAVTVHHGPFSELDQTYGALGTVVAERALGVEGPIREHYLVSAADTADDTRHRTEICWPIFQTTTWT